ncbi:hypothetical protein [Novipirellula sp.]|uniref:hypothetical protein n=1 Tax=Novipirellula sp. TaxID=2795430 RepID=UPI0035646E87
MNLLADNDAVVKLAQCRLLREVLDCFDNGSRYSITPTFFPWLRRRLKQNRVPSTVADEISTLELGVVTLNATQLEIVQQISSPKLDAGEVVLISAAFDQSNAVVCTGDKRAMRALANHPLINKFAEGFQGKFLCIEHALLLAINHHGFFHVRDKVALGLKEGFSLDTAICSAFGSGMHASEDNAKSALLAYVEDLRKDAGELLFNNGSTDL